MHDVLEDLRSERHERIYRHGGGQSTFERIDAGGQSLYRAVAL